MENECSSVFLGDAETCKRKSLKFQSNSSKPQQFLLNYWNGHVIALN